MAAMCKDALKPSETKDPAKGSSDIRDLVIFSSAKFKDKGRGKGIGTIL